MKALFSLALAAALSAPAAAVRKTDLNGDGRVDADDGQFFLRAVANGNPPALDLDGDGKTGLSDALLYGRWLDGLWSKPGAGLGSLYFQDPADSAAFSGYEKDKQAKSAWGREQLLAAFPDRSKPFAAITGPMEFENEVGAAFAEEAGLDKAGFMARVRSQGVAVADGRGYPNMFQALDRIHDRDLPLLFTSDALLHTIHLSYDSILARLEETRLIPLLDSILTATSAYAEARYAGDVAGGDVIELLGVARMLLSPQRSDLHVTPAMADRVDKVKSQTFSRVDLWGRDTTVDWSQFKPRGHYTRSARLSAYFQAMMWLSRADLAFDLRDEPERDKEAYTRMKRAAVITWDCLVNSGAYAQWLEIDRVIEYMVGSADGLSPRGMGLVMQSLGVSDAKAFVAAFDEDRFDSAIAAGRFGAQAILSMDRVYKPGEEIDLSPIFSFMPQRFILDSFTFSQLVHPVSDRIPWPSPLQVAFALGDNSALADLPDGTAVNGTLAAQRDLYDGISPGGWSTNLYTGWLGFLRKLNPDPENAAAAPVFRSPAWRIKMRNTQLASWAQLRHNTLLYAKQSYTGGVTCDFPKAYVEPNPAFFGAVGDYARNGVRVFDGNVPVRDYFSGLAATADRLRAIADRSARGLGPDADQSAWLRAALTYRLQPAGCTQVKVYDGWYLDLIYAPNAMGLEENLDAVIADVHTKPRTDEIGTAGVLHVGTGKVRLAAVAVASDSCVTVYAAPVLSFYEYRREGLPLVRLDDQEWRDSLEWARTRPAQPGWMKRILFP